MSNIELKTYALIGFSESGRGNVICITRAKDDYAAAAKFGGRLIEPAEIGRDEMMIYAMHLPPSPSGVPWGQFRFEHPDAAIEALAEATEPTDKQFFTSVRNVGRNSARLVLAEVLFLE